MRAALTAALLAALVVVGVAGAILRSPARLTLDGVGGVRPGTSEAAVGRLWGMKLEPDLSFGVQCAPASFRVRGLEGYAIFRNGRFGAVFLRRGGVTGKGIRVGSTLAQVRAAYGAALTSRPNKYTPGARDYFVRRARAPHWLLRIDVSPRGKVVELAFGDDSTRLVEACA